MPIEIKELHIHVSVNTPTNQASATAPTGGVNADDGGNDEREAIIAECVEQVMQVLEYKKER